MPVPEVEPDASLAMTINSSNIARAIERHASPPSSSTSHVLARRKRASKPKVRTGCKTCKVSPSLVLSQVPHQPNPHPSPAPLQSPFPFGSSHSLASVGGQLNHDQTRLLGGCLLTKFAFWWGASIAFDADFEKIRRVKCDETKPSCEFPVACALVAVSHSPYDAHVSQVNDVPRPDVSVMGTSFPQRSREVQHHPPPRHPIIGLV